MLAREEEIHLQALLIAEVIEPFPPACVYLALQNLGRHEPLENRAPPGGPVQLRLCGDPEQVARETGIADIKLRRLLVSKTPRGAARSVLLRIWPCLLAMSARSLRKADRSRILGTARISRPRYVCIYESNHSRREAGRSKGQQLQDRGAACHRLADTLHQLSLPG